jgi:hypothetical protein
VLSPFAPAYDKRLCYWVAIAISEASEAMEGGSGGDGDGDGVGGGDSLMGAVGDIGGDLTLAAARGAGMFAKVEHKDGCVLLLLLTEGVFILTWTKFNPK